MANPTDLRLAVRRLTRKPGSRSRLAVAVLSMAGIAAAYAAPGPRAEQRSDLSHSWDFSKATETREIEVEVSASARSVLVSANVHVDSGQVRFRLLDPTGAERVTGAVASGEGKWESGELPAVAGVWRALFELTEASGRMRVRSRVR